MCGIAGYYCFGEKRPDKQLLTKLFIYLQERGEDASGFGYYSEHKKDFIVYKAPLKASDFVKTKRWKKLEELPKTMILHARKSSVGSSSDNTNNHPIKLEKTILVHNGTLMNNEAVREWHGMNLQLKVDSASIAWLFDHYGVEKGMSYLKQLNGAVTFAMYHKENPYSLIIHRKERPLFYLYDRINDIFYFASLKKYLYHLNGKSLWRNFVIPSKDIQEVSENTCLIINENGLQQQMTFDYLYRDTISFYDVDVKKGKYSNSSYLHNHENYESWYEKRIKNGKGNICDSCLDVFYGKKYFLQNQIVCKECFDAFHQIDYCKICYNPLNKNKKCENCNKDLVH